MHSLTLRGPSIPASDLHQPVGPIYPCIWSSPPHINPIEPIYPSVRLSLPHRAPHPSVGTPPYLAGRRAVCSLQAGGSRAPAAPCSPHKPSAPWGRMPVAQDRVTPYSLNPPDPDRSQYSPVGPSRPQETPIDPSRPQQNPSRLWQTPVDPNRP